MHPKFFISFQLLFLLVNHNFGQDLFFSEFTPYGAHSVLEIYNPGKETVELSGYNVRSSFNGYVFPEDPFDKRYFDLSGYVINPGKTFVFAAKDAPEEAKLIADVVLDDGTDPGQYILHFFYDDALGLFRNDSLMDIIGKDGVREIWDVAGVENVTSHTANGIKTIIRKPYVFNGNADWDDARGYNEAAETTFADSSEWLVLDIFYTDLKRHTSISLDSAVVWSDWFEISSTGSEKDTIFFVPLDFTGNELLSKISTLPGVEINLFRETDSLHKGEILKPSDELIVWNTDNTKSHTYVIHTGNYNYLKESVIISEVMYTDLLRAIEVCNTTSKPALMAGWGIGKDGATSSGAIDEYTGFPDSLRLEPDETFVIGYIYDVSTLVPSSSVTSYVEYVIPYFDMYEKGAANLNVLSNIDAATSLILLDSNNRVIDRFQPGKTATDIDGMTLAFNKSSLVRRPYVNHGEPVWHNQKEADKETSGWSWRPQSYLDLGKHLVYGPDTAFVVSDFYSISSSGLNDSIYPVKHGITVAGLLRNIQSQSVWTTHLKHGGNVLLDEETIPEGSTLEVISTDLSFFKTYKISFGTNDLQLGSPEISITGDTVICDDLYMTATRLVEKMDAPGNGQMEVVNGLGNLRSGYVIYGDRVLVTAEDLSQKYYYIDFDFPADYSLIRSPFYSIDTILKTISGIPEGENPDLVRSNFILAEGQQIEILDKEGQTSSQMQSGSIVRITAVNLNITDYSVVTYQNTPTKQVQAAATQTSLPTGLKRSDVYLRSLTPHTQTYRPGPVNPESGKPWETIEALHGFHCTQLRWIYATGGPKEFITSIQKSGFTLQGTVNTHGNLLADDNHFEPIGTPFKETICPNKPGTTREYFNRIRKYLDLGSDGLTFHSDGGRWLMRGELDEMQICYCDYCNSKRSVLGITNPVSLEGKRFMLNSMLDLLDTVHTHFEDSLGHKIEWSANNSSRHTHNEIIDRGYTTAYGEVDARKPYATPAKWINDFRTAEQKGIMQIFQICSHNVDNDLRADDILNIEQYNKFVCVNRSHYAFAYAAGGLASVPWDSYTGDDQTRHWGLLSEFSDLSGFIRGIGPLLDGYENGMDYFETKDPNSGTPYFDNRYYYLNDPLEAEGNDNAVVFVRVKPGDEDAPVMVHLTEWFHIYENNEYYEPYKFQTRNSYTLKLRRSSFFNGSAFSIKLLTPAPYSKEAHELSQVWSDALLIPGGYRSVKESSAYVNLVSEEYLDYSIEGDFVLVEIPVLPHYGILKFEKALSKPALLSSAKYQVCGENIYIPDHLPVETLLSSLILSESSAMMVQDSLGFSKFKGTIRDGDRLAVLSADQSCSVYNLKSAESSLSMLLKHNNSAISPSDIINLERVRVDENPELNFTLVNINQEDIIVSEISTDNKYMQVSGDIANIPPGDSAIFKVKITDPLVGKNSGTIKITGDQCNQVPFHFQIIMEVVAADLLVRHQKKEIMEGGLLDYGVAGIGEEVSKNITLINYGKGDLVVSEIISEKQNITITPFQFTLKPAESKEVEVSVLISDLYEQEGTVHIRSNSNGPDSLLTFGIKAAGKDALMVITRETQDISHRDTLDFGVVTQGIKTSMEVNISNEGNEFLEITRIRNESNRLEISASEAGILPGESLALGINYSPIIAEQFLDSITISSSAYENEEITLYFIGESLNVGINPELKESVVKAFPIPFREKLELEGIGEYHQVKMVNTTGEVIRIENIKNSGSYVLDVADVQEGLYTLVLIGENILKVIKVTKY